MIYLANVRMPTEKAHGLQIAKMCEAFVSSGSNVSLIVPKRKNTISQDLFQYYNIEKKFSVTYITVFDLIGKINRIGFIIESITFALHAVYILIKEKKSGTVFSRDQFSLWLLTFFKRFILVYEVHTHNVPSKKKNFLYGRLLRRCSFVTTNKHIADELRKNAIAEKKILVAPNGYDEHMFTARHITRIEARHELQLPTDKKIILYTGHLYDWKGVDLLINAAHKLSDYTIVIVGGTNADIKKYSTMINDLKLDNILLLGHKPHSIISKYLIASDVLVLPNSAKHRGPALYTSPIKLFEYLASGVPVVASDLPSTREILDEHLCTLFEADNVDAFVMAVNSVMNDGVASKKRAEFAKEFVREFTWLKRAKKILTFIEHGAHS